MREIRWDARAGQGAKTASQLLAMALLDAGRSVQAFPEYGPERRGAPMRAYTRFDDRPIRRHDSVERPDVVVVLEPSLLSERVVAGLDPDGLLLVADGIDTDAARARTGFEGEVVCVPAAEIAAAAGSSFVNVVMVGALVAALGEPTLEGVLAAAEDLLSSKLSAEALAATRDAIAGGHRAAARKVPA